jgi:PAS domain S-box-containing protein
MNTALGAKIEDIEIRLYDARGGEKKRLLYEHRSKERRSEHLPVEATEGIQPVPLQTVVPFQIAGHQWIVQFAPTKAYLIAQRGWQAWSVLAGGLFFTGLLGGFLLTLTGHTAKLQAINTDLEKEITERKRAEDAVAQFAAIVESSDDAIIGTTLEGAITSWNKGAEIIYGYSAKEVTGRPISILYPPDRLDEMQRLRGKLQQGEHVAQYETIRVPKARALHAATARCSLPPRAVSGCRAKASPLPAFESANNGIGQPCVKVVWNLELAIKQSKTAMAARCGQWNELGGRLAGTRDDDLLAPLGPLDKLRQLGLRLMNVHLFHRQTRIV